MRALILAAGEGTRLRPLTLEHPKPMVPLGGRPLLEYLVDLLRSHGVREVAINLHYRPEAIVDHFGDGDRFGVTITYSHEERLLGSAGAARRLRWFLDEPFFVLYGDVLTDVDLTALAAEHRTRAADATVVVYAAEDPTRCGVVEMDADGRVTRFVEKPRRDEVRSRLVNAGIYAMEPSVLDTVPEDVPFDFGRDVFPGLLRRGRRVQAYYPDAYVLDVGSPERYAQAEADVREGACRVARHASLATAGAAC